jgi:hypothetical protein
MKFYDYSPIAEEQTKNPKNTLYNGRDSTSKIVHGNLGTNWRTPRSELRNTVNDCGNSSFTTRQYDKIMDTTS